MATVFSSPSFGSLAREVTEQTGAFHGGVRYGSFSDGWPDLFIDRVRDRVEGQTIWYLSDISRPEHLFRELAVMQALPRYGANKVHIVTPYFPTGTMERVDTEGQIATAKTLARLLSATPAAEWGMTTFHSFDIHALQERFYFDDTVSFRPHSALSLIRARVADVLDLSIAFPDEWAYKRFDRDFPDTPKIVCTKVRKGDDRIVTVKEWAVEGRNVLIVDDLIQSGGTIRESARKLRDMGARSVSAYATHGVFPGWSHRALADSLDRLYVTDSIPENRDRATERPNMEVLSIASLVSDLVRKTL